jgi:hypothetical protein
MSTNRKFAPALRSVNDIRSEVYAIETMKQSLVQRLSPQLRIERDEYKHLRKADPAHTPLRRTLEWVESLPPRVRPMALMRRFARVANLIAATWGHLEHFETYMESLLNDKRGNRKGFPPDVLAELVTLEVYRLAIEKRGSAWADVSKRG